MTIDPERWARARSLFDEALTRPEDQRLEFLKRAAGGDREIYDEVAALLHADAGAASFMESPGAWPTVATPAGMQTGQSIGHYRIEELLGAGGMGVVYRAYDTRLERRVAVKLVSGGMLDGPARASLIHEARHASALNHANICTVHEIGDFEGEPYIVMEWIDGEPLESVLARGLTTADALRYAGQIADALAHAHERGIIHRDLKSANVVIARDGRAKVLDFGIARRMEPEAIARATRRETAEPFAGTLAYMAPELLRGQRADERSDIWALGVVLHEMLARELPFAGRHAYELTSAIVSDPPRPLPATVPREVAAIVARCLAKDPRQRYRRASEVRDDLAGTAMPARTRPPIAGAKLAGVAAALLIAIALIVMMLTSWRPGARHDEASGHAGDRPTIAVLPLRAIDSPDIDATHMGVGIADAVVTRLANVRAIQVRSTTAILPFDGRTVDPADAGRQLQVDHVLTGTVQHAGDAYRFNLQLVRVTDGVVMWGRNIDVSRRDLLAVEDQVAAQIVTALQVPLASGERARLDRHFTENPDAYDQYLEGRALLANYSDSNAREAMQHFARALEIDPTYARAEAGLAMAAGIISVRFAYESQAAEWGRRAEEYATRALARDPGLGEAHLGLASAAGTVYRRFDWPTVIREAQAAAAADPTLGLAHSALARAYYHIGLLDLSTAESRRAREISGDSNIEIERVHLYSELLAGRFEAARKMAVSLASRTDAPVVRQYEGLALFYLGDRARARQILADVRRPDGNPDIRSQASLASVLAAARHGAEAERTLRAVLDSHYMDHHVAYSLGAAASQLGRADEAVGWLRQAAETGFPCYPWVASDTLLDPIRTRPEFQAFLTGLRTDYEAVRGRYAAEATR
jgi:eukaryotic-like serine/threonine-protein kinase